MSSRSRNSGKRSQRRSKLQGFSFWLGRQLERVILVAMFCFAVEWTSREIREAVGWSLSRWQEAENTAHEHAVELQKTAMDFQKWLFNNRLQRFQR